MAPPLKYQISKRVLSCTTGTETVILNMESSMYHSLDPVGGRFWDLVQQGKEVQQAVEEICSEYDVEPGQLEADLHELCKELQSLGLLEPAT
jgi:Coenzyme PQQ synthesis protein D (PqqD)